jgi:Tfp pilus assembly protein FimT
MKQSEIKKYSGFTILELMIVIGLMVIFGVLTLPYGMNFYRSRSVEEQSRTMSNVLSRAQSHAITGKGDSSWGVKLFHDEGYYTFFKGESYDEREVTYDQVFKTESGTETEGISEIVFEKNTGNPKIQTE